MNKLLAISLVLLGLFLPDKMQAQMAVPYKLEKYIDNAGKESKMTEYAKYSFFEGLAMVQNADGSVQYEPDGQPVCYKFKYSKDGYNYYYCYEKQLVMDYINNLYDYQYCFNNNKYLIVSADMTKITSVQKAYTSFGFLIPGYTKVFTQTTDEDIDEYAASLLVPNMVAPYVGGGYVAPSVPSTSTYTPQATQSCGICNGVGNCTICYGSGWISNPYINERTPCTACNDQTGLKPGRGKCWKCGGAGKKNY